MSTFATISAVAGKKGLESVIGDIYSSSKGQLRMRFKRWKAKKNIGVIYTKIKNIRKVKTILQPEKAVDLLKFYYPCKVKIDDERVAIRDISELHLDGNIIIKGMVGQGKSIFFRYLASREMLKGKRVPLFVELRRIQKNEKLLNHLIDEADALGLRGIDKDTFLWLAEGGKVVLLLDAFDEVPESERTRITNEIERLAKKYENMQILISSRPNSGIENSPFFQIFELAPLEGQEYEEAVCIMAEESTASNIIKAIRGSQNPIRDILTTPLMVALLIVRHRMEQTIPENMIGFYDGLFTLLISRHDRMKGGYTRHRRSGLGDNALLDIFEAICFLTKKENKGFFPRRELINFAKDSARITTYLCEPDDVIEDIEKITCLILEEGEECRFIHKSVQEYHAACFIKHQPDEIAQRFYKHVTKQTPSLTVIQNWVEELWFLKMIDKYRFLKWFLIPAASNMLGLDETRIKKGMKIEPEMVHKVFDGLSFRITENSRFVWFIPITSPLGSYYIIFNFLGEGIFVGLDSVTTVAGQEWIDRKHRVILKWITALNFFKEPIRAWAEKKLKSVHSEIIAAKKYVSEVEARKEVFEL